jgi:hypothetical protein
MTHSEPRTRRKSLIVAVVVGVVTLGAAVSVGAAPAGSKQAAPRRPASAANTPGAKPHRPAPRRHGRQDLAHDYVTLAPSRSVPVPGSGPNPTGLGPAQAFPDPYRNPQ